MEERSMNYGVLGRKYEMAFTDVTRSIIHKLEGQNVEKARRMEENLKKKAFKTETIEKRALLLTDLVFRINTYLNSKESFETDSFIVKTWVGCKMFKDYFPILQFPQQVTYTGLMHHPFSLTRDLIIKSKVKTEKKFLFFKYKTLDTYVISSRNGECTDISSEFIENPRLFAKIEQEIFSYIKNENGH